MDYAFSPCRGNAISHSMSGQHQRPQVPEVVTQESLLLAAVERVGRIRDGRMAVHLHLSKLRPHNRQDTHLRIALRMLDPLVQFFRAQIFLLTNSDIVILCKDVRPGDLDNLIYRMRGLFSKDPLTFADSGDGRDRFYDWYDLEDEYEEFLALAERLDAETRRKQRDRRAATALAPVEPHSLHDALVKIAGIDVGGLVRRQSAIRLNERNRAAVLFQELFVSMADLQRAVSPDVNLTGNRWLFQHLSQTLDHRVLGAISDSELRRLPPTISLNLNVTTIFTPGFRQFEQAMAETGTRILVETQIVDIFADIGGFFRARDTLRERGHKVLLDGITALTLQFMELAPYDADYVKLFWSPDFLDRHLSRDVRQGLGAIGLDRLILGRCDSEAAIQWGLDAGIEAFQGRYVDAMQSAMTMAKCDHAARCTLGQCIARHGVIAGALRGECYDLDALDSLPELRAPKRMAPQAAEEES